MENKGASSREILAANAHKIHTTEMGARRISKNLCMEFGGENPEAQAAAFCVEKIRSQDCCISRRGKNWYCRADGIEITVNAYSFTIITAHPL